MTCEICKFARPIKLEQKPEPEGYWFFGLFKKVLSEHEQKINSFYKDDHDNYMNCCRFPKSVRVRKTYKCGEYEFDIKKEKELNGVI